MKFYRCYLPNPRQKYLKGFLVDLYELGSYQIVMAIHGSNIYRSLELFTQVFNMVKTRYVEDVDTDALIKGAIEGMLLDLDPHSAFLDVDEYANMQEDHKGEFFGLGIQISVQDGVLTVISPIEGTPAYHMGIQAGDRIIKIEDEATDGITSDGAVKKLRGPKGSKVTITVQREGEGEPFELTITRDRIPVHSVPYHFMVRPGIGYARVTRFAKNTLSELTDALSDLQEQGMESLILDLRNNPGGYLNQAVDISDVFLERGKTVVSTKGRIKGSSEDYKTYRDNQFEDIPIIVVVNKGSASASEIVAGAVQDWDRGLILGQRTFGKGLVQRVYELSPNKEKALKLTIAKYYTPSGRLIQRDYDKSRSDYYEEIGTVTGDTTDVKLTSLGREVSGGGGILPDIISEQDTLSALIRQLRRNRLFFNFAVSYNVDHEIDRTWEVDEETAAQFDEFLNDKEVEYTAEEFAENIDDIELYIKREVYSSKFNREAGVQVAIERDKQIMQAVDILHGEEVVDVPLKAILDMTY